MATDEPQVAEFVLRSWLREWWNTLRIPRHIKRELRQPIPEPLGEQISRPGGESMTSDQWQEVAEQLAAALRDAHPVGRRTKKSYDALATFEAARYDGRDPLGEATRDVGP